MTSNATSQTILITGHVFFPKSVFVKLMAACFIHGVEPMAAIKSRTP
jgi:hypothetical protein